MARRSSNEFTPAGTTAIISGGYTACRYVINLGVDVSSRATHYDQHDSEHLAMIWAHSQVGQFDVPSAYVACVSD